MERRHQSAFRLRAPSALPRFGFVACASDVC